MSEQAQAKNNRLNLPQSFAVSKFLHTIEEKLKGEGPTFNEVAEWTTAEVGFFVTDANIRTICEADGIEWEHRHASRSTFGPRMALRDGMAAMKKRVDKLDVDTTVWIARFSAWLTDLSDKCREIDAGLAWLTANFNALCKTLGHQPVAKADLIAIANQEKVQAR
jgi:hypothetical protein